MNSTKSAFHGRATGRKRPKVKRSGFHYTPGGVVLSDADWGGF